MGSASSPAQNVVRNRPRLYSGPKLRLEKYSGMVGAKNQIELQRICLGRKLFWRRYRIFGWRTAELVWLGLACLWSLRLVCLGLSSLASAHLGSACHKSNNSWPSAGWRGFAPLCCCSCDKPTRGELRQGRTSQGKPSQATKARPSIFLYTERSKTHKRMEGRWQNTTKITQS